MHNPQRLRSAATSPKIGTDMRVCASVRKPYECINIRHTRSHSRWQREVHGTSRHTSSTARIPAVLHARAHARTSPEKAYISVEMRAFVHSHDTHDRRRCFFVFITTHTHIHIKVRARAAQLMARDYCYYYYSFAWESVCLERRAPKAHRPKNHCDDTL